MVCKSILLEEWVTRGISNLSNQEMDHCTNEIVARLGLFARIFLAYLYFFYCRLVFIACSLCYGVHQSFKCRGRKGTKWRKD